jgi:hypothetical protein
MTYSKTWSETVPAATGEAISLGPSRITDFKTAMKERLASEHVDITGSAGLAILSHLAGRCSVFFYGTTAEIAALVSPPQYSVAWDTDLKQLQYYTGSVWTDTGLTNSFLIRDAVRALTITNNATHPTYQIDVSFSQVILENTAGASYRVNTYTTKTADINAAVGVNALDTGTKANSTWYHIWIIAKADGTVNSLLSTSISAPTMPSGYTFKGYIGAVYVNSSGNFVSIYQLNKKAMCVQTIAINGGTAATYTAVDISTCVPLSAKYVYGSGVSGVSALALYIATLSDGAGQIMIGSTGATQTYSPFCIVPYYPTPTTIYIYYKVDAGGSGAIAITGWEF